MTREEAIRKLQKQKAEYLEEWVDFSGVSEAYDMAIEALSAEAAQPERKKGEWLMDGEKCGELMWRCSKCRVSEAVPTATSFISGIAYPQWKFCPNCGCYCGGEQECQ